MLLVVDSIDFKQVLKLCNSIKFNKRISYQEGLYIKVKDGQAQFSLNNFVYRINGEISSHYSRQFQNGSTVIPMYVIKTIIKMKNIFLIKIYDDKIVIDDNSIIKYNSIISNYALDDSTCIFNSNSSIKEKELSKLLECLYINKITYPSGINCLFIHKNKFLISDGYRISYRRNETLNVENKIKMNLDTALFLKKITSNNSQDMVSICSNDDLINIKYNNFEITTKNNEEDYPEKIEENTDINKTYNTDIYVDRKKLKTQIDIISKMATKYNMSSRIVKFKIYNNKLIIDFHGEYKVELNIEETTPIEKEFVTAFSVKYLKDVLQTYKCNILHLLQNSPINPLLIYEDVNKIDVVLPVRVV